MHNLEWKNQGNDGKWNVKAPKKKIMCISLEINLITGPKKASQIINHEHLHVYPAKEKRNQENDDKRIGRELRIIIIN